MRTRTSQPHLWWAPTAGPWTRPHSLHLRLRAFPRASHPLSPRHLPRCGRLPPSRLHLCLGMGLWRRPPTTLMRQEEPKPVLQWAFPPLTQHGQHSVPDGYQRRHAGLRHTGQMRDTWLQSCWAPRMLLETRFLGHFHTTFHEVTHLCQSLLLTHVYFIVFSANAKSKNFEEFGEVGMKPLENVSNDRICVDENPSVFPALHVWRAAT